MSDLTPDADETPDRDPGPEPDPTLGSIHDVPSDRPFRTRRGRAMALTMGGIAILVFGAVALLSRGWGAGDRIATIAFGVAMAAFLARYATLAAIPRPEGLRIRNLFTSRTVPWDEVLGLRWPDGDPWATLDLTDGESVSVMAIQRADAEAGRREALRLVDLIEERQRS